MTPEDATRVQASRVHPHNVRFQGWRPATADQVADHARQQSPSSIGRAAGTVQLVIEEDGVFVGDFGVTTRQPLPTVELGITLAPEAHGRGIATRATTMLLDGLFGIGIHRVTASVDARNVPSLRLFQRLGFRREGVTLEAYYDPDYDEWSNEVWFAMLRREWPRPI